MNIPSLIFKLAELNLNFTTESDILMFSLMIQLEI